MSQAAHLAWKPARSTINQQAALDNPQAFAAAAVSIIKDKLADQLAFGEWDQVRERWQLVRANPIQGSSRHLGGLHYPQCRGPRHRRYVSLRWN
jgi:hypothetical protein